ncbi:MAG: tRNA uridine-5-carboxymethylaminomethyl(34) synthesis GTPase MnmE [Oscillospiraceae bacterium]
MDTIAGIATPPGEGGIAVIRISGDTAFETASRVFRPRNPSRSILKAKGYTAVFGTAVDGPREIDEAIALVFRAPRSYTGEDEVEIQCHGGNIVPKEVFRAVLKAGASPADRGEFTRRAFLNGRISLTEAEAVAEIVSAQSRQGEAAAYSLMKGSLYRKTQELKAYLVEAEADISASIEFPDEVSDADPEELKGLVSRALDGLSSLLSKYDTGQAVMRGIPVVIAGSPNVGKSTILNLITGTDRAIVSPAAGTTRDIIEASVDCGGLTLILSDTAGIRDTDDYAEAEGVRRALDRIGSSALLIAVFDGSRKLGSGDRKLMEAAAGIPSIAIINKDDLPLETDIEEISGKFRQVIRISALEESSRDTIVNAVRQAVGADQISGDSALLISERQRKAAMKAEKACREALKAIDDGVTLDAVHVILEDAISSLAELSGENVTEEVLDDVFSRFCVGK